MATMFLGQNSVSVAVEFGGTDLGEIFGGVKVHFDRAVFKTKADSTGDTPRSEIVMGSNASAACALTEVQLDSLAAVSIGSLNTGETRLALSHEVGRDLLDDADELIVKPIIDGIVSTDPEDWICIPKAVPLVNFDVELKLGTQNAWGVTFEGHPVLAEDIASGGNLDGKGYAVGDMIVFGD